MTRHSLFMIACALSSVISLCVGEQSQLQAQAPKADVVQVTFSSPQVAVDVLIKAAENYDVAALSRIFGPAGKDFISTSDPVREKATCLKFAKLARKKNFVKVESTKPKRATLFVGDGDWPFPVPLVYRNGRWRFDSKEGRTEILYRRIGSNELDAIAICLGFVNAQNEYALTLHGDSTVNQYAQRIISTPGKQDGLYWQNPDGTGGGPIGEAIARAIEEGYSLGKRTPYHGYYFKVLKGQGAAAPLGHLNYVIDGAMIGGFALVAAPAQYRVTGVKTFMVSQDGIVYEKDLGPDTLKIVNDMDLFNPDATWVPTRDEWPAEASAAETAVAK
jgi:hypothetical protein